MVLSRPSNSGDPLSDVLQVLGAQVARRTRMEAGGRWAFSFPAADRLKFVALIRGSHWIILPDLPPRRLREGDVCLLGQTSYTVASHPDVEPVDGSVYFSDGRDVAHVGGDETIGVGGSVTFEASDARFLLDMIPTFLLVPQSSSASGTIAAILRLIDGEWGRGGMGRDIVSARLADILLIEAMRAYAEDAGAATVGWLGALADVRMARVLRAIHDDVARPWTVASLAQVAGMSRAGFAAEFMRRVGQPPLAYLRGWRLTLARTVLARGSATVASVAEQAGYRSHSAFSQAYRRAYGTSPKGVSQSHQ